jgi:predicted  nucleic acid-binding Zn-ribbon protein
VKLGDLSSEWAALLEAQGPGRVVEAIRDALLSRQHGGAVATRALELLLLTAKPEQSTALIEEIREDWRRLRNAHGNASADQIRIASLESRKRGLEAKLAQRAGAGTADADLQHRIRVLAKDEGDFRKSLQELTSENISLKRLLEMLGET